VTPHREAVDLAAIIARYRPEVEACLRTSVPDGRGAPELFAILKYHLGWLDASFTPVDGRGGKMLRPVLCLLACAAAGGDYRRAMPAAAALELLHNFSLIHDDVEDRGTERHGRKTVWAQWGEPLAVNAGDALLIVSELTLLRSLDVGLDPGIVLTMSRILNECCLTLTEGQHLDLTQEGNPDIDLDTYFRIIRGKTAALLGCSTQLGALAAGATPDRAEAYRRFGEHVGLSFQIQDDVLGIWGNPQDTGKPAAADVYGRKVTLPVIDALARAPDSVAARIAAIYRSKSLSRADVGEAIAQFNALGTRQRAEVRGEAYLQRALGELVGVVEDEAAAAELRALAASLVGRKA
jgi:geranylgeranyl diphosphate synthase, type I